MAIKTDAYYASCTYDSPVGMLTLAASEEGLKGLWLNGQKYFAGTLDRPMTEGANDHLDQASQWLDAYFAGESPAIAALSLAPNGSGFQQAVWKLLCEIPSGEVRTYGDRSCRPNQTSHRKAVNATGLHAESWQPSYSGHSPDCCMYWLAPAEPQTRTGQSPSWRTKPPLQTPRRPVLELSCLSFGHLPPIIGSIP